MTRQFEHNMSETALQNLAKANTESQKKFDLVETMASPSSNSRDVEIANTIISQICSIDPYGLGAIGFKPRNGVVVEYGILLRNVIVEQSNSELRWGHIQIVLNSRDYYDVTAWSKDKMGLPTKVIFEVHDADFTQLPEILRNIWE